MQQQQLPQSMEEWINFLVTSRFKLDDGLIQLLMACFQHYGVTFKSEQEFMFIVECVAAAMTAIPKGQEVAVTRMQHTKTGVPKILLATGLVAEPVDAHHAHYPANNVRDARFKLVNQDLREVRGWLYRGAFVPYGSIKTSGMPELVECESCHQSVPADNCAEDQRIYFGGKDRLITLCNQCRLRSDDMRVRDTANAHTCRDCTRTSCSWNPRAHVVRSGGMSWTPPRPPQQQPQPLARPAEPAFIEYKPTRADTEYHATFGVI